MNNSSEEMEAAAEEAVEVAAEVAEMEAAES